MIFLQHLTTIGNLYGELGKEEMNLATYNIGGDFADQVPGTHLQEVPS